MRKVLKIFFFIDIKKKQKEKENNLLKEKPKNVHSY